MRMDNWIRRMLIMMTRRVLKMVRMLKVLMIVFSGAGGAAGLSVSQF